MGKGIPGSHNEGDNAELSDPLSRYIQEGCVEFSVNARRDFHKWPLGSQNPNWHSNLRIVHWLHLHRFHAEDLYSIELLLSFPPRVQGWFARSDVSFTTNTIMHFFDDSHVRAGAEILEFLQEGYWQAKRLIELNELLLCFVHHRIRSKVWRETWMIESS